MLQRDRKKAVSLGSDRGLGISWYITNVRMNRNVESTRSVHEQYLSMMVKLGAA